MKLCQAFVKADKNIHKLKTFDCGKSTLNDYLARFAVKNMHLGLNTTWVLPVDEAPKATIASYYTLASATVSRGVIPTDQRLPAYPVPVVLLARLAVDKGLHGNRLGEKSLVAALRHAASLTQLGLPAFGLILDVLDDDALAFYNGYDLFMPFTNDPMRLFVPMETALKI